MIKIHKYIYNDILVNCKKKRIKNPRKNFHEIKSYK